MAWAMSAMPGPLSSNTILRPTFAPFCSFSIRTSPPPPYLNAFRAISLVAVTNFTWSTVENLHSAVQVRASCRTVTMSASDRICQVSLFSRTIDVPLFLGDGLAKDVHAPLDVERHLHARKLHPQLDQR